MWGVLVAGVQKSFHPTIPDGRTCLLGSAIFFCSDSEHKMEGELLKLLRQTKEAGGSASLTFTTRDGKMKAKLEVELDPPAPASPSSTPPPPTTSPAPGRGRRRQKGAAAKVKARAARPDWSDCSDRGLEGQWETDSDVG